MNIAKSEIMNHELSRLNINILFSFLTFFIFLYVLRTIALVTFRSYNYTASWLRNVKLNG